MVIRCAFYDGPPNITTEMAIISLINAQLTLTKKSASAGQLLSA